VDASRISVSHAVAARKVSLTAFNCLHPALSIGIITSLGWSSYVPGPYHSKQITDLSNPFPILVWVYVIWNGYHFGMQNFGVLSLYRDKPVVPDGVRLI
jgi:hypothetical protein